MALKDILTRFRFSVESGKLRQVTAATRAAEARMRAATRQARELSASVSGIGSRIGGAIGIGALGMAFAGLGRGLLDANVESQNLNAMMLTVTGSAEKAKAAMDFAAGFAAKTPFQISEVTSAYIALQRRGIDPTAERLTALGDITSANNRSMDDMLQGITGAVSSGTTRMLEGATGMDWAIRGSQITATQWDGTKITIDRTTESLIEYLTKLGQMPGIAGGMARKSATLGGAISNLKDQIWQLFVAIGEAGLADVLQAATKGLERVTAAMKKWTSDTARMKRLLDVIVKGAALAAAGLGLMVSGKIIFGFIKLIKVINDLGTAGMWANAKLLVIPAILALILLGLEDLIGFTQGKDSLFGRMLESAGIDPEPIRASFQKVGAAFRRIGGVFYAVGLRIWASVKKAFGVVDLEEFIGVIADVTVAIAEGVAAWVEDLAEVADYVLEKWPEIEKAIVKAWETAVTESAKAMKALDESTRDAAEKVKGTLAILTEEWEEGNATWVTLTKDAWHEWSDYWGGDFLKNLQDPWGRLAEWLKGFWYQNLVDTVVSVSSFWVDAFSLAWGAVKAIWNMAGDWFGDLWRDISDAFLWSIESAINSVVSLLREIPGFIMAELPQGLQDLASDGVDLRTSFAEQYDKGHAEKQSARELSKVAELTERLSQRWIGLQGLLGRGSGAQLATSATGKAAAWDAAVSRGASPSAVPPPGGGLPGMPPPAQTVRNVTVQVGDVSVPVSGTVDMSAPEMVERIKVGATEVFQRILEATFDDTVPEAAA